MYEGFKIITKYSNLKKKKVVLREPMSYSAFPLAISPPEKMAI